jgi:hypothetical protein
MSDDTQNIETVSDNDFIKALNNVRGDSTKDTILEFLREGDFDKKAEFEMVKIFLERTYNNFFKGEKTTSRQVEEVLVSHFDFIKIASERYKSLAEEGFWDDYINILIQEAVKHIKPTRKNISYAESVGEKETIMKLLEDINSFKPFEEIEAYRQQMKGKAREVIFDELDMAYAEQPGRNIGDVEANARRYDVEIPSEIEYWEHKSIEIIHELNRAITELEALVGTEEYGNRYYKVDTLIKTRTLALDTAKHKGVEEIEVGEEIKKVDAFLHDIKKEFKRIQRENQRILLQIQIEKVYESIGSLSEDFEAIVRDVEPIIKEIERLGDKEKTTPMVNKLINEKIDPALDRLATEIKKNKDNLPVLVARIAKLSDIRKMLQRLL